MDNMISNVSNVRGRDRERKNASDTGGDDIEVFSKMLEEKTNKMERHDTASQEIYSDKREKEKAEAEEKLRQSRMSSGPRMKGMKDELFALSLKDPGSLSLIQKQSLGREHAEPAAQGPDMKGSGMASSPEQTSAPAKAPGAAAVKDMAIQEKSKDAARVTQGPGMAQEGPQAKDQSPTAAKGAEDVNRADAERNVKREEVIKQIIQHVELKNIGNRTELSLKLNPEYLGEMRLKLVKDGDRITAEFQTVSPLVREAIEESKGELTSALNDYGIELRNVKVDLVEELT